MAADRLSVAHVDAERGFSGGEVQVMLLLEGLRERGHRNVLIAPPRSEVLRAAAGVGIETAAVRMRNEVDLPSVLALAGHFRSGGFDLVHLHTARATWLGGLAARMAKVPALTTRRMDRPIRRGARTRLVYEHLVRRVAAISPGVRRCLVEGGVPPDRIVIVPSAIEPSRLRPARPRGLVRAELGAADADVVLLVLATLTKRKGVDVLLGALEILGRESLGSEESGDGNRETGVALWIAGDGPERATLEAQAVRCGLGDRAKFLGRRDDKADLLAASDVLVMPSRQEGLGVAVLEAMAAGRPVVGSRVGGLQDAVVQDRTGLLVEPDNPGALADALRDVIRHADLRRRLGEAGPARVAEGFMASQMVASYERLYREILHSR